MNGQKIHFTGIGGIGMSALAQFMAHEGATVTGTDLEASPVTEMLEKQGITVLIGPQVADNVAEDTELLVYSDAVKEMNAERMAAKELDISQLSYFEMLGQVSKGKRTVAVAGTHGKTTTTGMLAKILRDADASPTAIVGSVVTDFGSNYLAGTSDLFVVEACEYQRHFLNLTPHILVVTNIEFDHSDYFKDLADVQSAFRALMEKVPAEGVIVTDMQNPAIAPLLEGLRARVLDYTNEAAHELALPGDFNEMNARAAACAAKTVVPDITDEILADSLKTFRGSWRRFEYKGKTARGVDVYDDYAHHPTAVQKTLRTLRAMATGRILVAFHPHLYSRTRDLLDGFATSFGDADEAIIAPIYAAREVDDGTVSSALLAERITAAGGSAKALPTLDAVEAYLRDWGNPGDVIMTMGAGDIYKVADAILGAYV